MKRTGGSGKSKKMNNQFACSSMMLPEHRGRLNREREQSRRREEGRRPLLDEQEQERFQQALERSLREGVSLELTVLDRRGRRRLCGNVIRLEPRSGRLCLRTPRGTETVSIDQVVYVDCESE